MKTSKNKPIYGVGINDYDGFVKINTKLIKSYSIWFSMLTRCYSNKVQERQPTYIGCTVCDEWLYFSKFKKWFDKNYIEGFQLDKDILVEGNKVYSPDTCRFIPAYLNSILTDCKKARSELPIGVRITTGARRINHTYSAQCSNGYGKRLTKTFKTIDEASSWYSETKKRIVKEQATMALVEGKIELDLYNAFVSRVF